AGMPPLDVDESGGDQPEDAADADREPSAGAGAGAGRDGDGVRRRGAVPLVPGAKPADSNRDTHTSMRVPAPDELAGPARGTARAPRAPGARRPGSARNRAAARRRRAAVGAGAVALLAAVGVGVWLVTGGDNPGAVPRDTEDTRNSAPASP
ncbi:serine/threonine protein kinase, partial [Streptomyces sp. TRM76130]|nr:serine/threonine protein kinase [Streptomyces sp. TRM76130]